MWSHFPSHHWCELFLEICILKLLMSTWLSTAHFSSRLHWQLEQPPWKICQRRSASGNTYKHVDFAIPQFFLISKRTGQNMGVILIANKTSEWFLDIVSRLWIEMWPLGSHNRRPLVRNREVPWDNFGHVLIEHKDTALNPFYETMKNFLFGSCFLPSKFKSLISSWHGCSSSFCIDVFVRHSS